MCQLGVTIRPYQRGQWFALPWDVARSCRDGPCRVGVNASGAPMTGFAIGLPQIGFVLLTVLLMWVIARPRGPLSRL